MEEDALGFKAECIVSLIERNIVIMLHVHVCISGSPTG